MKTNRHHHMGALAAIGILGATLAFAGSARADLDEEGFEGYTEGELLGQQGWMPQEASSGEFREARERMEVKAGGAPHGQTLVWIAGFGGKEQTRLVKRVPSTTGSKALVRFDFLPGSANIGGRLYFEQKDLGSVGVQFVNGMVHVLEADTAEATDTGVEFKTEDWNRFELRWDFEKHNVEVLLDGQSLGHFQIPDTMTGIDQLNFFAGGTAFSSAMDNLTIESVSDFPVAQP